MEEKDKSKSTEDRDPRFDWPYATEYLLETLDPELIEAHGEQILSRALNIGRTVGFIGAGVAMSYGRISWQTLVETELARVEAKLIEAEAHSEWNSVEANDARRLAETLRSLKLPRSDIRTERYPMLFQVSEQLDEVLNKFLRLKKARSLHSHAMTLTVDDEGQAYQILIDALRYDQITFGKGRSAKRATEEAAREFIEGVLLGKRLEIVPPQLGHRSGGGDQAISPKPDDHTAYRLFYDTHHVKSLLEIVRGKYVGRENKPIPVFLQVLFAAVENACIDRPARYQEGGEAAQTRRFLLPTDRYLVGVLLHLAPRSDALWKLPAKEWWGDISKDIRSALPPVAITTRHELVTQWRDPLLYMQERLQINRYITTNYDHEIERMFRDQAFRHASTVHSSEPRLRPSYDEIVFDNNYSGELTAFSVRDRSRMGSVVHLHGRAEKNADERDNRIVVTENDYQRRYLREDFSRRLVDDSIRLAFGSNPILFVGSNMGEDDLLRPLRQFMSGPARVGDRVAIAIVPAMTDRARRTEDKIALLGRYGVYAIHFGKGRFRKPEPSLEMSSELEWLPWFWSLRKHARDILLFLSSEEALTLAKWESSYAMAAQAWKELVADYKSGPELTPAAENTFERLRSDGATDKVIAELKGEAAKVARASNSQDAPQASLDFELFVPAEIEGQPTGRGTIELCTEVGVLNAVLVWLGDALPKAMHSGTKNPGTFAARLEAKALLVALEGAGDSTLSIFTCGRLSRIKEDWESWKRHWFEIPVPAKVSAGGIAAAALTGPQAALTGPQNGKQSIVAANAIVTHRHAVRMPLLPESNSRLGRFYRGAPSQSLIALLEALDSESATTFREARGRRFLILSSRRGLGKGHFFSSLEDCDGVSERETELGPTSEPRVLDFLRALDRKGNPNPSQWIGLAFMSLSFSQEVMSAFDRIIDTIYSSLKRVNPELADQLGYERLQNDRIERLRLILFAWTRHATEHPRDPSRVLVAFNGFSILFDHNGHPKNGQVKRICDLLFSSQTSAAPIDFVLLCQNDKLPVGLVGESSSKYVMPLIQEGRDPKGRAREERTLKAAGLGPRAQRQLSKRALEFAWQNSSQTHFKEPWRVLNVRGLQDDPIPVTQDRAPAIAIHVLRETRAIVIASAYFPRVAILLARHILRSVLLRSNPESEVVRKSLRRNKYPSVFESHAKSSREAMRHAFNDLQANKSSVLPKHFSPVSMSMLAVVLEFADVTGKDIVATLIELFLREVKRRPPRKAEEREDIQCLNAAKELLRNKIENAEVTEFVLDHFEEVVDKLNEYMRSLYHTVRGGRFLLTLIFTAAYESTAGLSSDSNGEMAESETSLDDKYVPIHVVDEATNRMMRMLDHMNLTLMGVPTSSLSNVVVEEVISTMRRRSDRDDPLPLPLVWDDVVDPNTRLEFDQTPPALKPLLHKLMVEILWHLAIIGQPAERAVLEACPRVRNACKAITDQSWSGREISSRTCVREALALATNRGLTFCIGARDTAGGRDDARYAVHRLVQRHIFRSLGASDMEFTDVDQFTLSLYGSQPDDLPRLTLDAHRDISDVIAALSGYPMGPEAMSFGQIDPATQKILLRASFGIIRTIYSVAVLSRFDRRSDGRDGGPGREGYFEEHRRRIRWLISASVRLTKKSVEYAPFYTEEIVWLYNECAVLSVVEGRLSDAHALFGRALEAAKDIEPDDSGPLHVRILLNKSLSDIERGHNAEARSVLERIASLTDEHPVPPLVARGYLGLIDHLSGQIDHAIVNYEFAINGLAKIGRSRAASIFSRHYGDLLGGLRQPRVDLGRQRIEDAIHFAQDGGHEDIRYLALLSLAKLHIRHPDMADGASVHKELDAIEGYAQVVGMPRMLCEVALTRAHLLLRQGETERAATLANEGLKIACMNDLRLRKVSGLLILAAINLRREQIAAAKPLVDLGTRMAKAANSHFSLTHAQALEHQFNPDLGTRR